MKIELGGGPKPYGNDFLNIDKSEHADLKYNLSDIPWPIDDDTVTDVYSSHCLEHLINDPVEILNEICRVCVIGATVIIKMPMPGSDMALCWDHKHVFSPIAAMNIEYHFPKETWHKPKRPRLNSILYRPSILLSELKRDLPFLNDIADEKIIKWFPRACHDCTYNYTVVENEYYDK